jgi:hypothetical protein
VKKYEHTDRSSHRWVTIGVTALPAGWANRYRTDNGETFIEPAPGLLLQQSGSEVRVVFATYENGCLTPVVDNANYCESYIVPDAVARPPKRTGPPPR